MAEWEKGCSELVSIESEPASGRGLMAELTPAAWLQRVVGLSGHDKSVCGRESSRASLR